MRSLPVLIANSHPLSCGDTHGQKPPGWAQSGSKHSLLSVVTLTPFGPLVLPCIPLWFVQFELHYLPLWNRINVLITEASPAHQLQFLKKKTHRCCPLHFCCSSTPWPLGHLRNLWKCWRSESPSVEIFFGKMPTTHAFRPLLGQPGCSKACLP